MVDAETRRLEAKLRKKAEKEGEKPKGREGEKEKPAERPGLRKGELKSESIIRLAETNLDGTKKVIDAIRRVRGVSFMMANAISRVSGFGSRKLGELSEQEREKLEDIIMHADRHGIPSWMCNRRRNPQSGEDKHMAVSELELTQKMDVDLMRKLKTYKGVRHSIGLPVRGQRTRGSFRKGRSVGVSRKKERPAKSDKKK